MAYSIEWETEGTLVVFSGVTNITEINSANGVLHGDDRISNHRYTVWNFLDCDVSSISKEDLEFPAAIDSGASKPSDDIKIVLVMTDLNAVDVFNHYVNELNHNLSTRVGTIFSSLEEAYKWCQGK